MKQIIILFMTLLFTAGNALSQSGYNNFKTTEFAN